MANLNFAVTSEGEIALIAATPKTLVQLVSPPNQAVDIRSASVGFDGTNPSAEPVQVELVRQTTAGTMTAATPVRDGRGSETIQTTAQKNATVEPTTTDVLRRWEHHPQSGSFVEKFDKREVEMAGGTRIGLRVTAPFGVNAVASLSAEE